MEKNPFCLLDHKENEIYPNYDSKYILNSFCLLNKTIGPICANKRKNETIINLKQIKEYDKRNNEKAIKNNISNSNNLSFYNEKRKSFIEDSFYKDIIEKKSYIININKNIDNFKMLSKQDKSKSSLFYHIQIIKQLKKCGELNKAKEYIKEKMEKNDKNEYEKLNYALISPEYEGDKKNIKCYRRVKANGNSFYISFIFQYFKYLIKRKEESIISEMFYIMDKELNENKTDNNQQNKNNIQNISEEELGKMYIYNSIKNSQLIYLNQTFSFIALLYNYIVENNIEEAEKLFNFAFTYEESFANFFVLYMRLQIKQFIRINKNIFTYETYCKSNKIIDEKYYKNREFLYDEYIKDNVLSNQMEPSLFIISLVPYAFNVSMNLYINEQNSYNVINFDIKEKNIVISILYSSFSYHIIDLNSNITIEGYDNVDIADTLNINRENLKNFKKDNYVEFIDNGIACQTCNKSNFISLKNISNSPVCLNCLKNEIDEILIERYKKMKIERFKYIEFYLRDIPLIQLYENDSNYYIFLSPTEFYCIFECNIFTYFRKLIKNTCDTCKKYKKIIINKNCGCRNCIECAKNEIKDIYLTEFDKNYLYKNRKIDCRCGKQNDFVEYTLSLYNKFNDEEKKQLQKKINLKMKLQCRQYCMLCGTKLNSNNIGDSKLEKEMIMIKVGEDFAEHYICEKCNKKNKDLFCIICQRNHKEDIKDKIENNESKINNSEISQAGKKSQIMEENKKSENRINIKIAKKENKNKNVNKNENVVNKNKNNNANENYKKSSKNNKNTVDYPNCCIIF